MTIGVDFAVAAAEALSETGLEDFDEAVEITDGDEDLERDENNQPYGDDAEGAEDDSVFKDLEETNPHESGSSQEFDVPGVGLVSLDDLIKGYMKDADYTQKTQKLAEERKEHSDALALWRALQDDPYNTVRQLSAAMPGGFQNVQAQRTGNWSRVDELAGKEKNGANFTNGELDQMTNKTLIQEAVKEMLMSDPDLQVVKQQVQQSKVDRAFGQLETELGVKFTDSDRALMLDRARRLGATDLRYVYFVLNQEVEQKRAAKNQIVEAGSQPGIRGDSSVGDDETEEVIETFRDAVVAAAREVNLTDIL